MKNKKTIVICFHPNLERSQANSAIIKAFKSKKIDVNLVSDENLNSLEYIDKTQKELTEYSHIVFLFPFYWYSSPYLLNKWFEKVLTDDYAFEKETKLKDKSISLFLTVGGSQEIYEESGENLIESLFLSHIKYTIKYIKANLLGTHVLYEAHHVNQDEIKEKVSLIIK